MNRQQVIKAFLGGGSAESNGAKSVLTTAGGKYGKNTLMLSLYISGARVAQYYIGTPCYKLYVLDVPTQPELDAVRSIAKALTGTADKPSRMRELADRLHGYSFTIEVR